MASYYLVVDVLRATVIWTVTPGKLATSNFCVEVSFNEQSFTTAVKGTSHSPVWNERFYFPVAPDYFNSYHGNNIKFRVYHVNIDSGSRRLIGTGDCIEEYFRSGLKRCAKWCPWTESTTGPKGMLLMKVLGMDTNPLDTFSERHHLCAGTNDDDPLPSSSEADGESPALLSTGGGDAAPKEISPSFKSGQVVEERQYLFVRVVRAHDLPDVDANGSLDPYVVVGFGGLQGVTTHMRKNKNPEWNTTFAFPSTHAQSPFGYLQVVVKDKDVVRDEVVGELQVHLARIPVRSPHEIPLAPSQYRLDLRKIKRDNEDEPHLTLAIWIGSQADEAYHDAWIISDNATSLGTLMTTTSAKVYETPSLWFLRISVIECHGISMGDLDEHAAAAEKMVYMEARIGIQMVRTRAVNKVITGDDGYFWNEDLTLVVDPSLGENHFIISVKSCTGGGACKDEIIGRVVMPVSYIRKRVHDDNHLVRRLHWFKLEKPYIRGDSTKRSGPDPRLCLRLILEGGYHVPCGGYHSAYWSTDDTRPVNREIPWKPPIGKLELGILSAIGLPSRQHGKSASSPYCMAKYGGKWIRTRTVLNSVDPVFNEQYRWDVYDIGTLLTVGVFDNCQLQHKGKASTDVAKKAQVQDAKLGKVLIRLSSLEAGRIYAHSYPLVVLLPSGARIKGELQLAVRLSFSSTSLADMVHAYSCPALPKMNYTDPLSASQLLHLQDHAIQIAATGLSQVESPPRKEVVEYMCGAGEGPHLWSMRKSKAYMYRILAVITGLLSFIKWFQAVRSWSNPAATLIVHAIFVLALWFHELVLPSLLMSLFLMTAWNYQKRPTCPSYIDLKLSQVDTVTPNDLDEEFDAYLNTDRTGQSPEVVAARYDRLRCIASRLQTITGDLASRGERIQALVTWTDRRATALFELFALMAAMVLYFVPFKVLVAVAGLYIMRHPVLRWKGTPLAANFFARLPSKEDSLL